MDHHSSDNDEITGGFRSNMDTAHGSADEHDSNRASEDPEPVPPSPAWYHNTSQITAMLSNFSTSYNVVNISLVLPILEQLYPTNNSEDAAACASSLLAGMVVGQLVGGALGDSPWLGRLGALLLVMALQIAASIGSSLLFIPHGGDIYLWLAGWRFLLGIGAGGVYPLAAVLSAEQGGGGASGDGRSETEDQNNSSNVHRVVLTFSTQGLGFVMVPIVSVGLLHTTNNLDLVWRLILGLGSLPGFLLMVLQYRMYNNESAVSSEGRHLVPSEDQDEVESGDDLGLSAFEPTQLQETAEHDTTHQSFKQDTIFLDDTQPENDQGLLVDDDGGVISVDINNESSFWESIRQEPGLGRKLLGTAGTWFLFDVLFYGNTIFQPIVVEAAFGGSETDNPLELLQKTALDSLLLTSIALPGYVVAGLTMGEKKDYFCISQQTPRYVMLQGFAAMSILYFAIGWNWSYLRHYPVVLVVLYGLSFFFANYGPNTTTFILPSLTYSHECRSTLNGISAACGKLGALVGATLFEPAAESLGDNYVMIICSAVSVVALILTHCCVPQQGSLSSPSPRPAAHSAGRNIV